MTALLALVAAVGAARAMTPTRVVVPADGAFAVVLYVDDTVRVWRPDGTSVVVAPIELSLPDPPFGFPPEDVRWVGVSADGRTGATGHEAGVVAMFDPRDGRRGPMVEIDLRGPITGPWTTLRVQPPRGGAPRRGCADGPRELQPIALSADGKRLLTVGYAEAGVRVALWGTARGDLLRTWTADEHILTAGFAASGEPVVQAGGEIVVLGEVPRFVAHGVGWSRHDPVTGTLVADVPAGFARVDPVSGEVTLLEPTEPRGEEERLTVTSADGSVRVTVGADGAPRFEPTSPP